MIPLLNSEKRWDCDSCQARHITTLAQPHSPMHQCRGRQGLLVPFKEAGTKRKVTVNEREDYVGSDIPQIHEGRPVMSATIESEDRIDSVVYAATATARIG